MRDTYFEFARCILDKPRASAEADVEHLCAIAASARALVASSSGHAVTCTPQACAKDCPTLRLVEALATLDA